ncbi:uncharacterized protein BJ212DRAFT_1479735 [Suillus subaureus]|uniref:Uncharacterized protein n=1 Tax=Suillus subaureus TaxID=48587 RepID=A0A9P7EDL3_9AGAM|nr:uncharacterized protein BJ212DRAFT_1479735 [Suillus subaureus]KAG1818757.1 hypothetical protein BJ212DRAFT_1479735 [Suillus subaureus]
MQLSVLFSAFVSFAILAAASPTQGAISKRSSKRENLDINFQRDLLEESEKRAELEANLVGYIDYGGGSGPSEANEKREELEANLVGYVDYGGGGISEATEKREDEEDYAPAT